MSVSLLAFAARSVQILRTATSVPVMMTIHSYQTSTAALSTVCDTCTCSL